MPRRTLIAFVITVVVGVTLITVGRLQISNAGDLYDRSERLIATVMDGHLEFNTVAGRSMTVLLQDDCKFAEPPPDRGCLERYDNGDEVLVWYDPEDPSRTWEGSAPIGGGATFVLYLGIVLTLVGVLYLWFILHPSLVQWIGRMKGNNGVPKTG
jgi:hypothetical protein